MILIENYALFVLNSIKFLGQSIRYHRVAQASNKQNLSVTLMTVMGVRSKNVWKS